MTADEYLYQILRREAVDTSSTSPVRSVQSIIQPTIQRWAGNQLDYVMPSGSFAKGTGNRSGTDIDLFVSLTGSTTNTLKEIYESLSDALNKAGYTPRRQNVSLNITVNGYSVDLVPAKRQDTYSQDHSLYRRKADTWTKTNVAKHIAYVQQSGFVNECRLIKLWRMQKRLDFPSFYVELSVINALSGRRYAGGLASNVLEALGYLRDSLATTRIIDPANTNNIISDDLTSSEKAVVASAARISAIAKTWEEIIK
ncbi:MAG: nucleotidyltransferase [Candidatus Obscuribacter phosphatis]|uniref:Nucleotidyltransferase n=1 Tax=Candidatus Obscuribacter phosphatis TaxID=1906157 RepID=A0A8J7TL91_9BACT|nr:nucleotidyltransferase [Candidatus Obscuribacter phosphatis]